MRKKLFWWIAGAALVLGCAGMFLSAYFNRLLPGIKNSSEFIERFNEGAHPVGIELGGAISEDAIYREGGYICQVVQVVGNEDLRFLIYSRRLNGEVYAIRIDEIIDVYSAPTRLNEINDYLYAEFFMRASEREVINSRDEFAFLTETEEFFGTYMLDSKYFKCIFFNVASDHPGRYMRTTVYSSLPAGFARGLPYPFGN